MHLPSRKILLQVLAVLALVTLAYANHFHNGFHFDDFHTVNTNPYIRDLHNIPRFFKDADTFSTLPANRGWRPLVTTSLAVDYALGKGLTPVWFQTSTFLWFLLQLCLMFAMFRHLLDFARPGPANRYIALFATALYGVHPAIAETVNYVIQRGDVYSTLGVVAGLLLYIRWPHRRNQGIYLIPVALALLSKPPALVFPAILFVYLLLFEDARPLSALLRSLPALLLSAILGAVAQFMTPKSFDPGAWPARDYRLTQPLVALRYFRNFFLPTQLSADTDHIAETSIFHGYAWLGALFLVAMIVAAVWLGRRRHLRPIAFGFYWYILALLPTSIFPLAEVENDHRMYFPFVGLVFSLVYAAALPFLPRVVAPLPEPEQGDSPEPDSELESSQPGTLPEPMALREPVAPARARALLPSACAIILLAACIGTWHRNIVWKNEESLWYDVTLKSPKNGRGLMNYGLTQMEKGDYVRALNYFNRAVEFNPDYWVLEINLGIANGALNNDADAERHFWRSLELAPQDAQALYFYAVWLRGHSRYNEAIQSLNADIAANPAYLDARYLLMWIYHDLGDTASLQNTANALLAEFPTDANAQAWLSGTPPPE